MVWAVAVVYVIVLVALVSLSCAPFVIVLCHCGICLCMGGARGWLMRPSLHVLATVWVMTVCVIVVCLWVEYTVGCDCRMFDIAGMAAWALGIGQASSFAVFRSCCD